MENNPYQAPTSKLITKNSTKTKHSIWWKVYSYFVLATSLLIILATIYDQNSEIYDYISAVTLFFLSIGLYGFVFLKPIFRPQFWLILLFVEIPFELFLSLEEQLNSTSEWANLEFFIFYAIGWSVHLPAYYAVYSYSRPLFFVWNND